MIYITGDTHGDIDFKKLKTYFAYRYTSEKDILIILGDAGIIWSKTENYVFDYSCLGPTVLFIDGNHENFGLLKKFPIVEIYSGHAHRINNKIYHLLRGEIFKINGLSFLAMGGATSIDRYAREEGVSWWQDENILDSDIDNAIQNLKAYRGSVDYVLTHCAPGKIVNRYFHFNPDHNCDLLQDLMAQVNFKHWYFGHYHIDTQLDNKFRCFYNDVLEIPALYKGDKKANKPYYFEDRKSGCFLKSKNAKRPTSLRGEDLPEWYLEDSNYDIKSYYKLKDVVDVAFTMSPFSNHISKDSSIYFSYSKKLKHKKDYEPLNPDEWESSTWRTDIVEVTNGLAKYSPHLNLDRLKARINMTYDQFNNNELNSFQNAQGRPFPLIKTPPYKKAQYLLKQGLRTLGTFEILETAQKFIYQYIKTKYPNLICLQIEKGNPDSDFLYAYDVSRFRENWLYLKKI
jgi:hypothetical protein